jgi:DNA invertase Pin-like site-specific DNA recombinase
MQKFIAVYERVSSKGQDTRSQRPELEQWAKMQTAPVKWFSDKFTGKSMDRKDWGKIEDAIRKGRVLKVAVWRLDRLGRTARGLTALFEDLRERKINLVSLRDGLDLNTPAGRLMANVLASVAQYETEVRQERQVAGIAAAKRAGKRWGGSKPGVRKKVTEDQIEMILAMKRKKKPITRIAKAVNLTRPTIYSVLEAHYMN